MPFVCLSNNYLLIILNKLKPCVLEVFKSLNDKLALLDAAIKIGDGNALTTVRYKCS